MEITDGDLREFRERAKTELRSGCDPSRLAWDNVVDALCREVLRLREKVATCPGSSWRRADVANALKPCPFCGGSVSWQKNDIGWFIKCQNWGGCLVCPETVYAEARGYWRSKQEVADAWNRRATGEETK